MKSIQSLALLPARVFAPAWFVALATPMVSPALAQTTQFPEVLVTATRYAEPASTAPYSVGVITAEDIQRSGASSVSEAIVQILGVPGTLDTSGGNNYGLDLRGYGTTAASNQVVIVDGIRINDDDSSMPNLGAIPIASVQRIEVLRGAGAVQYGAGASGGVILISTRSGSAAARANTASVRAEAGSSGLVDTQAGAALGLGDVTVDVAGQDHRSSGNRDNFASENSNLSASAQWRNAWLRVGVTGGNSALHSGLPGALTVAQFQANPEQTTKPNDWGTVATTRGGLLAEANVGSWTVNFDAAEHTKQLRSVSSGSPYGYDVDGSTQTLRARNELTQGRWTHALVMGIDQSDWTRIIRQSSYYTVGTRAASHTAAWYVSDDISLATATRLHIGFRNEDAHKTESFSGTQIDNNQSAWMVGVDQSLAEQWNGYVHTGQSFRLANADEFSYTDPTKAIQPQTARDHEAGLRWANALHQVELRLFRSEVTNEIGYDPQGFDGYANEGANINLDPTVHQGLEVDSQHALHEDLTLRLSWASRSAKFAAGAYAGNSLPQVPTQTAAIGVDLRPAPRHLVNLGLHWVSAQKVDFANTCSIPAYTTLDSRYAYSESHWEWSVAVKNLTDQHFYTQAYNCTGSLPASVYPEPGRTVSVAARLRF